MSATAWTPIGWQLSVTKLHRALTEAPDDNFCMRLYTSTPKISVYKSAFVMTPFLCDSWALVCFFWRHVDRPKCCQLSSMVASLSQWAPTFVCRTFAVSLSVARFLCDSWDLSLSVEVNPVKLYFLNSIISICYNKSTINRTNGVWTYSISAVINMPYYNKWSKNFDERPHCRLVTPCSGEWIRPTLILIKYMVSWAHLSHPPNVISIGASVLQGSWTWLTDRQTDRLTDRPNWLRHSICSNRLLSLAIAAMRPNNTYI